MKERPILFSGEMVRAILDGRKTQTRRVVKPQPVHWTEVRLPGESRYTPCDDWSVGAGGMMPRHEFISRCPYGQPGDRLWVREAWCHKCEDGMPVYTDDGGLDPSCAWYRADGVEVTAADENGGTRFNKNGTESSPWVPSIHMPRWASRITLEITGVRVERVQEISHKEALAEGVPYDVSKPGGSPLSSFHSLWDSINAKRGFGWDKNPWVWVIEFRRVTP